MSREMTGSDLPDVIAVDRSAFAGHGRGDEGGLPAPRRRDLLAAYLAAGGGLVEEVEGRVAGFVFWHRWGTYGWMGPLAVDPALQDRGLGKRLVEAARLRLTADGVRVIGLETWPWEGKNLTLYARLSFRWDGFCLLLSHSAPGEDAPVPPAPVDDPSPVRQVAGRILPGLDPTAEVGIMLRLGLGELFADEDGFVFCQRGGTREGTDTLGQVKLLLAAPGAGVNLRTARLLDAAGAYFRAVGMREVLLPLYADQLVWLPDLLARGWRAAGSTLRAYYPAPPPAARGAAFFHLLG